MKLRQDHPIEVAAAKADISRATGYRIAQDPRLPSQTVEPRERRRPDPLEHIFENEVVPLLKEAPGLRPVAIFDEMLRRHPECQSAPKIDPLSASKIDPFWHHGSWPDAV